MTRGIETLDSTFLDPGARINNNLSLLVTEQRQSLARENSLPKSTTSFRELKGWFKNTDQFHQIYRESSIYFCTPRSDHEITELRQHFVGYCYEFMSYSYQATKQPEGLVLLSPRRTLALHESLYPNARKHTNPFGLGSLICISVPDGLQIHDIRTAPKILSVIEYTLANKKFYLQNKLAAYENKVQQFPELFGNTQLVFVIPARGAGGIIPPVIQHSKARVVEMPFTHRQFGKFINSLFEKYRPDANYNRPTLNEIQESISIRPTGNKGGR